MIEITAIRLDGGDDHEHIAEVMWRSSSTTTGACTVEALVEWLNAAVENHATTMGGAGRVEVGVVSHADRPAHLRARVGGVWGDDLLSLPRF